MSTPIASGSRSFFYIAGTAAGLALAVTLSAQQPPAPAAPLPPLRILLDASPRAVEYQLNRLSNAELARVERKDADPRYRPIYVAVLTRKGMGREQFDDALAALTKLDKSSRTRVLLDALGKVPEADQEAADRLVRVLLSQPADALRGERAALEAASASATPFVRRGAYGGVIVADGSPDQAWALAAKREGHLVELLRAIPSIGPADLRARLFDPIAALLKQSPDAATRVAALSALGSTRTDTATFSLLAQQIVQGGDAEARAAAVRSLQRLPKSAWPTTELEPVVRALAASLKGIPPAGRADPAFLESAHLAESLAAAVPGEPGRALRRDVRAVGVQVVRVGTIPEQMSFDLRWFAVEAGKAVQIVYTNPDAMTHNMIIGRPGSLKEIGNASMTMSVPTDPNAKPYVPDSPNVMQATRLLNWGETERLAFNAPRQPGDYVFVCTFPGHWVRMYGIMLVVPNLDEWEANRTVPNDPMTGKPFASQRVE